MIFTTVTFVAFFFVVFLGFYGVPKRFQWQWLLIVSYFFYGFASPIFLAFLLFSTLITYAGGLAISNVNGEKQLFQSTAKGSIQRDELRRLCAPFESKKRSILLFTITLVLGQLVLLKYSTFLLHNAVFLTGVLGMKFVSPSFRFILPIGLSFYTFQAVGYCLDVYWENVQAERNLGRYALFVSFFPQILQGPIGTYADLAPQLSSPREFAYDNAVYGAQRALWGFFKKLVIANQIGVIIDPILADSSHQYGLTIAFTLALYSIQLYADFSGYMDIALGCSEMLGIRLAENFDTPYFSTSITEFWRKWHITLGAWFKSYIFFPLLRSRGFEWFRKRAKKSKNPTVKAIPTALGLLITWILIGLWHGAAWSYLAYGLYHGAFIIAATLLTPWYARMKSLFVGKRLSRCFVSFQMFRTFILVTLGYGIFRLANLHASATLFLHLFSKIAIVPFIKYCHSNVREFLIAGAGVLILAVTDLIHLSNPSPFLRLRVRQLDPAARRLIYIVALVSVLLFGAYGADISNQFAYFKF